MYGFVGGHNGHLLYDLTQSEGLSSDWTWTGAETRTSTLLVSQNNDASLINEPGLPVSEADWEQLKQDVREHLSSVSPVRLPMIVEPAEPRAQMTILHVGNGSLLGNAAAVVSSMVWTFLSVESAMENG